MAKAAVLNWNKDKVSEIELNSEVFDQEVRKDLLHTVVKWQLAKRRAGTHKAKTRGEVRGGGKKPFKQKGTGNARQGSTRSPLNPGGGVTFGPSPRDYNYTLPKKVKKAALRSALSYLNKEGRLHIVEDMDSKEGKTKELVERLSKFGLQKAVLIDEKKEALFQRASQNLQKFVYYPVEGINVYDLLKYDNVVISKESLAGIEQRCGLGAKS